MAAQQQAATNMRVWADSLQGRAVQASNDRRPNVWLSEDEVRNLADTLDEAGCYLPDTPRSRVGYARSRLMEAARARNEQGYAPLQVGVASYMVGVLEMADEAAQKAR